MILAVETSAKSASIALVNDKKVIGEFFINAGLTHCETLFSMIKNLLHECKLTAADIDYYAVSIGPGSFTGIRICVCAVKGMAEPAHIPCVEISTLEAIATGAADLDGLICCVMDARRNQVYNALFRSHHGHLKRLCEDRAISVEDLFVELQQLQGPVFLVGDGSDLCYNKYRENASIHIVSPVLRLQTAIGVALAAEYKIANGQVSLPESITPSYLRPSQAERERLERLKRTSKET